MSGLNNVVKQPTRENTFLVLILAPGDGKVHFLPKHGSSDHRIIYAELDLGLVGIEEPPKHRKVFQWGKTRWGELKKEAKITDFNFEGLGVQEAVDTVTAKLQELTNKHVPSSVPTVSRPLPWWDAKCEKVWHWKKRACRYGCCPVAIRRETKICNRVCRKALK